MNNDPLDLTNGAAEPKDPEQQPVGKIERLQQKLYSPNTQFQIRKRKQLQNIPRELSEDWQTTEQGDQFQQSLKKKPGKMSVFTKVVIVAFVFFAASLGYAFFAINDNNQASVGSDVELTVIGPVAIGGGEELSLDIIIENNGTIPMQTVDVVIEYPDGTKDVRDLRTDLPRVRDGVGDILPNSVVRETYDAALFGEEGEQKDIEVRIEYRVPGSTAIFEKNKTFTLALQSSPIRLAVDTSDEITSGQEMDFNIVLASNSNEELRNVILEVRYPFGFRLESADIDPLQGTNNRWYFDSLEPQQEIAFQVRGTLDGQDNEERVFRWQAGIGDEDDPEELAITFTEVPRAVLITKPFLALSLSLDGELENDVVRQGATAIEGRLTYTNNTGAPIQDAEIILKLDGEVVADETVQSEAGFYNSTDNTIIWNKTTNNLFDEIPTGSEDTLIFRFQTKPLATRSAVYKNPEIDITASVKGTRLAQTGSTESIETGLEKRVKIASDVTLGIVPSNAGGPFQHSGPIPPIVEEATTYTLTMAVTNSSNALKDAVVTAVLPPYMRWNNAVSPSSESVTFDQVNRVVSWNIGDLIEHAGFIDPARQVAIQLTLVPSASQIGHTPELLFEPRFQATDTFTNTTVQTAIGNPNTDFGFGDERDDGKVVAN